MQGVAWEALTCWPPCANLFDVTILGEVKVLYEVFGAQDTDSAIGGFPTFPKPNSNVKNKRER